MSEGVKRFYDKAEATETEEGFELRLDGRTARSPGRRPLSMKSRALCAAMAEEWAAQGEVLDMKTMPLTRLGGQLVDADEDDLHAWRDVVESYAGTDLLCYRSGDTALARREAEAWQPFLDRMAEEIGSPFAVTEGIVAVSQPAETMEGVAALLRSFSPADILAARHMTEITGSAVLALSVVHGADPEAVFAASRLDERHQAERWGIDEEAAAREAALERDFRDVARFRSLAAQD